MDIQRNHFIVFDGGVWGKGKTIEDAVSNMPFSHKPGKSTLIYQVTENTKINDEGGFSRPHSDAEPELIRRGYTKCKT